MHIQNQLFINGEFVDGVDGASIPVHNPHDGSLITNIAEASETDVNLAVEAARRAFPAWSCLPASERGRLLLKLTDAIEADADGLAQLETLDTGHPIRNTRNLDVPRTVRTYRYFGGMADKLEGSLKPVDAGFLNYVTRQPVGQSVRSSPGTSR